MGCEPFWQDEERRLRLHCGDCSEVMASFPANSVDTILTDSPYGLEFMGEDWDSPTRAWTAGAGMADLGIGKRDRPIPSFSAMSPHGSANPTCAKCGGRLRGRKKCRCEQPEWKPIGKPRKREKAHFHKAGLGGRDRPIPHHGDGFIEAMHALEEFNYSWAKEALRVAKPGAMLLAFGGTRTSHRLTCALEDAGWIIRDTICWLYGSGFPKSLDLSKAIDKAAGVERRVIGRASGMGRQNPEWNGTAKGRKRNSFQPEYDLTIPATDLADLWNGWGTGLKPAWEPIILAMKPLDGTFADNAKKWGVGGLNVDGGRIPGNPEATRFDPSIHNHNGWRFDATGQETAAAAASKGGRFPANLILGCACDGDEHECECPVRMLDEQAGPSAVTGKRTKASQEAQVANTAFGPENHLSREYPNERGGPSRFFYTAKASRSERERGLFGHLPCAVCGGLDTETHIVDDKERRCFRNNHPTVKPVSLMRYLVRLTATPTGGVVLDPFCGSGTTGIACLDEGREFVGIDQDPHYLEIAQWRLTPEALGGLFREEVADVING